MIVRRVAALLCACLLSVPALAERRVMVTGEWPPYTGVDEPEGGTMTAIVRAAFAAAGDDLRVGFFAWSRIRRLPQDNSDVTGSFPHYYSEERAQRCYFSDPIGSSPLGLALRPGTTLEWKQLEDLGRYRIGAVNTYSNSLEFDRLVASGRIRPVRVPTDLDNLRNLLAGKVDAALIDRNVLAYLQASTQLRDEASLLRLDPRLVVMHKLYACFPRTAKGRANRDRFNKGLATLQAAMP